MRPDCVLAQGAAAAFLAFAGVDRLEVVDVTVRFIEVAVPVEVVTVPHIKLCKVRVNFSRCLAGRQLGIPPRVAGVPDKSPCAARVLGGVVAVEGSVVGHLDPVRHRIRDRVLVVGNGLVVALHGFAAAIEKFFVVGGAEVLGPQRGVVHRAVRFSNRVVQWTGRRSEPPRALVAELGQDGEDLVLPGGLYLGELIRRQLHHAVFIGFRLPLGHLFKGCLPPFNEFLRPRSGAVVLPDCRGGSARPVVNRWCGYGRGLDAEHPENDPRHAGHGNFGFPHTYLPVICDQSQSIM
ncbi:hypothetical protein D9M72_383870 [compost metagenome]